MNNFTLINENYFRRTALLFCLFTRVPKLEMSIHPVLSLPSTIINDSSYFCRLYRHWCKERNEKLPPCWVYAWQTTSTRRSDTAICTYTQKQIPALFRYISSTGLFCKSIMQHKMVAQRLIFSNCPELESSLKEKQALWCGRVFMENMNIGSMQLLCLLISPQGWGTLRLYCFTTADGLLGDVHSACLGCVRGFGGWCGGWGGLNP